MCSSENTNWCHPPYSTLSLTLTLTLTLSHTHTHTHTHTQTRTHTHFLSILVTLRYSLSLSLSLSFSDTLSPILSLSHNSHYIFSYILLMPGSLRSISWFFLCYIPWRAPHTVCRQASTFISFDDELPKLLNLWLCPHLPISSGWILIRNPH